MLLFQMSIFVQILILKFYHYIESLNRVYVFYVEIPLMAERERAIYLGPAHKAWRCIPSPKVFHWRGGSENSIYGGATR